MDLPMTSLVTSRGAEVPPSTAYCSDEIAITSGFSTTGVLVLTALGALCTRRCFRVDFPDSGGPTKTQGVTSTDTEPCFSRDSLYASMETIEECDALWKLHTYVNVHSEMCRLKKM